LVEKYQQILDENLSVREIESLTKTSSKSPVFQPVEKIGLTKNQLVFKDFLSDRLSTKVSIVKSQNGSGKISLNFNSEAELNRIIQTLKS
jgi:ParB family chromosome partitioning protein